MLNNVQTVFEALDYLAGVMPVTSVFYLMFLVVAVAVFYALRSATARAVWLLVLSATFYALMSPRGLIALVGFAAASYVAALAMGDSSGVGSPSSRAGVDSGPPARWRRVIATASVVAAALALALFKFSDQLLALLSRVPATADLIGTSPALAIAMPVGVSFWTFQLIAYLVDVYRGQTAPVRNPLTMLLAVVFFPIVTIGPITKVDALVEQFGTVKRFDFERMRSAVLLMGWGFFKKLVVADRLAVFVNSVYTHEPAYGGIGAGLIYFIATAFFAIQLYADFSGYTDIVRGSARLMGVDLPQNFAGPYLSRSVAEFWRRWHMTLMDWLKRYVYIPLGGNRKGAARKQINALAVFAVSGLWHGTGLNFMVWGLLNGAYVVLGELLAPQKAWLLRTLRIDPESGVHRAFQRLWTFVLVTVAWAFFRAESLSQGVYVVARMFVPTIWILTDGTMLEHGLSGIELFIAFLGVVTLFAVDYVRYERGIDVSGWLTAQHVLFRWLVYYGLITVVVVFGWYGGSGTDPASFLYFKF